MRGKKRQAQERGQRADCKNAHGEASREETPGSKCNKLQRLCKSAGEEEGEGAEGEWGSRMITFGETMNPMGECFRRADAEDSSRDEVEDSESEVEHDEGDAHIHVPRHHRRERDRRANDSHDTAEEEVGDESANIETEERLGFLPLRFCLMQLLVFCGECQEETSGHGKAAAGPCDESNEEDAAVGECVGGGGSEGGQIKCLQKLVRSEDDEEGAADLEPLLLRIFGCAGHFSCFGDR